MSLTFDKVYNQSFEGSMYFFFGGDKKEDTKITNQFIPQIKLALTSQFCQFCNKLPATKVSFVSEKHRGFTCNNCQMQATGNDFKNLGEKTLIPNDKLAQTITKSLINYQANQTQSPQAVKQLQNQAKLHLKQSSETVQKIKSEMKILKSTVQAKLDSLVKQSEQGNLNILFQQLNKKCKDKKSQSDEIIQLVCKKALVNKKGLHFVDEDQIQSSNQQMDQRVNTLKAQMKIKLKQVDELTDWINKIEL